MSRTVKSLAWHLLYANCRQRVDIGTWDGLVRDAGGPDLDAAGVLADVPAEAFVRALERVQGTLRDSAVAEETGRAAARAWAQIRRNEAPKARAGIQATLASALEDAHAFLVGAPGGLSAECSPSGELRVSLADALPAAFQRGFVAELAARTGAATEPADGGFVVRWPPDTPQPARTRTALAAQVLHAPVLAFTLVPVLAGAALAANAGAFDPVLLALTLAGVGALHLGTHQLQDYFEKRQLRGRRALLPWAAAAYAFAGAIGIYLTTLRGWPVLALGLVGFAVSLAHAVPPLRLSYRGLGELAAAAALGPITVVGAHYVQTGAWSAAAVAAGTVAGALLMATLLVRDFPDIRTDAAIGKRTLVVRLGLEAGTDAYAAVALGAHALVILAVLSGLLPPAALLTLVAAPWAFRSWRVLRDRHRHTDDPLPAHTFAVLLHLTTGLLLAAGIAAAGVLP